MAQAVAYTKTGSKKETAVKLSSRVFGAEANHELINQAYQAYLANGRSASARTLTRGEVRGGGRKPWRQKGTGRARAGSTRLPHWTGGGVAFGPTGEQNFTKSMPVKAKRAAIRQALSLQAADKKILILDGFEGGEGKVKPVAQLLDKLKLEGNILLVVAEKTPFIDRSTRNLAGVEVASAKYLNVFNILNSDTIILTADAYKIVTEWLEA
jgi:large subunit ribosomal protein L4